MRLVLILRLPCVAQCIARGQTALELLQGLLDFREHRVVRVACRDVRCDGRHAGLVFPADGPGTLLDAPCRDRHQGHLDASFGHHGQLAQAFQLLPIGLGESNDDVVLVVPVAVLGCLDPVDRPANRATHLGRVQVVQRSLLAIDLNRELGPCRIQIALETDELSIHRCSLENVEHLRGQRLQPHRILSHQLNAYRRTLDRTLRDLVDRDRGSGNATSDCALHLGEHVEGVPTAVLEVDKRDGHAAALRSTHPSRHRIPTAAGAARDGDDGFPVLPSSKALELLLYAKHDRVSDGGAGTDRRLDIDQEPRRRHALREELRAGTEHGEHHGGCDERDDGTAHEQEPVA